MATMTDTFTGSNGTLIDARNSDSGHSWTKVVGDGSNDVRIDGNRARGNGTTEAVYLSSFTPAGDFDMTVPLDFVNTTGNALLGVIVRADNTANEGYVVAVNGFSDTLTVTDRQPDTEVFSTAWTAGDQTWTIELRGDTFTLKVGGSSVFTDDVSHLASDRVGVYKYSGDTGAFFMLDSVEVTEVGGSANAEVVAVPADGTGDAANPVLSASSTVVTGPADGTGDTPSPVVSADGNATVTAVMGSGGGDIPGPTVAASSTVAAAPADATGDIAADIPVSVSVGAAICQGTGDIAAPAVTGQGDATVIAVTCDGTGDAPNPTATASAVIASAQLDGSGDVANPLVTDGTEPEDDDLSVLTIPSIAVIPTLVRG